MRMSQRDGTIVAFVIAMLASGAFAQSQTGTLVGLIHDPQHTVITGAEVHLSRVDASQPVSHTITDTGGRFEFVGLRASVYSLELTLPGWQRQLFSHLNIEAARTLDVNIVLMRQGHSGLGWGGNSGDSLKQSTVESL